MSISEGFEYRSNILHCEDVSLPSLAKEFGTPFYVYSKSALVNRVNRLKKTCDSQIYFAVKSCSNIHILSLFQKLGLGADIVSGGELFRACVAQFDPQKIVYSGVGKTRAEIEEALKIGIHSFNIESVSELSLINETAKNLSTVARVMLRVNPNVDAKTHPYISTGLKKNKFGLSADELKQIYGGKRKYSCIEFLGLSCHIGSQIQSPKPFESAWKQLLLLAEKCPFKVQELDLGGGLGISYQTKATSNSELTLEKYGRLIQSMFGNKGFKTSIEPGRSLVGPTGMLVTSALYSKKRKDKNFLIVDAAMNDLIRPALYKATHPIIPVKTGSKIKKAKYDVVGPVCESADSFLENTPLSFVSNGDLLAFIHAGAYGMSMSSQYNSRPRVCEILVDGQTPTLIRSRETYADLIKSELV